MKKKLLICGITYVCILLICTIYIVQKGNSNYFGYKKQIATAKNNIKSTGDKELLSSNTVTSNITQPKVTSQPSTTVTPQPSVTPQQSAAPSNSKELVYSKITFNRNLKKEMTGEDVKKLQELLISKNMYNGEISGKFDNDTEAAVKKFQKLIKVTTDGVVGTSTWTKLLE